MSVRKKVLSVAAIFFVIALSACASTNKNQPEPVITPLETHEETAPVCTESSLKENEETACFEDESVPATTEQIAQITEEQFDHVNLNAENMYPVLIDTNGVKASIIGYSYANNKSVFELDMLFENNTADELSIRLVDVIVDGFDISTTIGRVLVDAGHKAICDSSVWEKKLKEAGITEWAEIEGRIVIANGYWGEELYSIPITIAKECWETEDAGSVSKPVIVSSPEDTIIPSGALEISKDNLHPSIYDNDGIVVSVQNYSYANAKSVFQINMIFDNQTDQELAVMLTDVVVNGFDLSSSTGKATVDAGHKAVCDSSIWKKNMTPLGINDWEYLTGIITVRKGLFGDRIIEVPVVIYKNAWESA